LLLKIQDRGLQL